MCMTDNSTRKCASYFPSYRIDYQRSDLGRCDLADDLSSVGTHQFYVQVDHFRQLGETTVLSHSVCKTDSHK